MNIIDFLQAGGYRLKQATLRKMQESYFEILKAFVKHLDMPDVGNYIISGCTIVGANITPGVLYIDGEICSFEGAPGTLETLIKKQVVITNLPFKSGANLPVFRTTNAIVDPAGVALSAFVRIPTVKELVWANIGDIPSNIVYDAGYVHTDVNFTAALKAKLDTLAPPDWGLTDPEIPGYITGKPEGNILTYLHKATFSFGDVSGTEANLTVTFADVGTTNYMVLGSLVSNDSNWTVDNDVFFTIKSKTATSFNLLLHEVDSLAQNLAFDYILIPF